jgi:hypothetical protein
VLLLVLPLVLCACKTAGIKDAFMARDSEGRMKTSVFKADKTEIHLIVEMASGRDDVILRSVLSGSNPSMKASQEEFAPGKGDIRMDIYLYRELSDGAEDKDGPWMPGEYKFDLYLDDEHEETVTFSVQ